MARLLEVTAQAEEDLQEITLYLYPLNEAAAQRIAGEIQTAYLSLIDFPYRGRSRSEILPGLRSIVADKYVIFYRVETETVSVERILHGARNLALLFGASGTNAERN